MLSLVIVSLAYCLLTHATTVDEESSIAPLNYECPSGSGTINFAETHITEIGPGFINNSIVTCLDLKNNQIQRVTVGAFDSLPNLKQLNLAMNKMQNLDDLFSSSSMLNLEVLNLTKNRQAFNSNNRLYIAGSFPSLRTLSLDQNFIVLIESKEQLPFPKLERLDLSRNQFASQSFSEIVPSSIKFLNFSTNKITNFIGKNWTNLSTLDLSHNQFKGIAYNNVSSYNVTLVDLKSLRNLTLAFNSINTIKQDAFTDTGNLEVLDLTYNYLSSIPMDVLTPLKSLKVFLLGHNSLREVPRHQSLLPLVTLDLGNNLITTVSDHAFLWAYNLKILRLNNNKIEQIYRSAFILMEQLEVLDLSSNKLSMLPSDWCSQLTNLQYLDLSNNRFTSFEFTEITSTLPLKYLFFEYNTLKYLKTSTICSMPSNVTINLTPDRPKVHIPDIIYE